MAETPYVETEVLLAFLEEDEQRAISLLTEMTENERAELEAVLHVMLKYVSRPSWCLGCGGFLGVQAALTWVSRHRWHPVCLERHQAAAQHAQETVQHVIDRGHFGT